MKYHFHSSLHWASRAACTALTATALCIVAPVVRAQSPEPSPSSTPAKHDGSADIFDAIKKGADKLQKQAKDASKIEPQLKAMEERQAEFIKHQTEVERRLTEVLLHQESEIRRLADAVERLTTEIKNAHAVPPPHSLPVPPAPPMLPVPPPPPGLGQQPPPPPHGPAAPLPATEPPATPAAP